MAKFETIYDKIGPELEEIARLNEGKITKALFEQLVAENYGCSKRTIESYTRIFRTFGVIRPAEPGLVRVQTVRPARDRGAGRGTGGGAGQEDGEGMMAMDEASRQHQLLLDELRPRKEEQDRELNKERYANARAQNEVNMLMIQSFKDSQDPYRHAWKDNERRSTRRGDA